MTTEGLQFRADLLGAGVSDSERLSWRRRGEVASLRPGAYIDPARRYPTDLHLLQTAAAARQLSSDAVVCGVSAAIVHRLAVWIVPLERVHVLRPRRSGARRGRLVHVRTGRLEGDERTTVGSLSVTTVARTLVDLARSVPFEQSVVTIDHALRRHRVTTNELDEALERAAGWPKAPAARRAIAFADGGSASVGESRSRVAMHRCRLPPPQLQWPVRTSGAGSLHTPTSPGRSTSWWASSMA